MTRLVLLLLFFSTTFFSHAQKESYPKNYFIFPITPGQPNTLSGVLGDLRSNHFHGGLDIRTQQREGLLVHAAADGYVSRIAVQGTGYGNVIYLRHPNGMTTVYGHLQVFQDSLAAYVRREQYKQKSFYIDLEPKPNQFLVKKGQVIALSGNTGGSGGPHLHFEIRDSKNNHLNPLYFNFKEITDNTPPAFWNLALRPTTIDSRVNAQFERQVFKPVKQKNGSYLITRPIRATGEVGIELQAYDYMSGTGFRYGLHCIEIKLDGKEIFSYNMEKFPNTAFREYNNLIDYRTEKQSGNRFYRCYMPDGNDFDLYKTNAYQGKIRITDTLQHEVVVRIFDSFENSSLLRFTIQGEMPAPEVSSESDEPYSGFLRAVLSENVLSVTAPKYTGSAPSALFYAKDRRITKAPAYYSNSDAVFLADLREFLPDSVQVGNTVLPLHYKKAIAPRRTEEYSEEGLVIRFDSTSLFDTLYLAPRKRFNSLTINEPTMPLRHYLDVRFKPEGTITKRERTGMYLYNGNGYNYVGGNWLGDVLAFRTREFGNFVVMTDTIPPTINLVEHSKNQIRAYVYDDLSGIEGFRASVNGEWVLLNYEYKSRYLWSEKLDKNKDFAGELSLEITDRAGNSTNLRIEIEDPVPKPVRSKRRR